MPVPRRISEQVKAIQKDVEADTPPPPPKRRKHKKDPTSTPTPIPSSPTPSPSSSTPVPSVQRLSFDGLEVTADTSLAGVSSARTRRRRESQKVSKEVQRKRKRSPTPSTTSPAHLPTPSSPTLASLTALHQLSHPPTPAELSRIHNQREKRAIQRRVDRDATLVSSAVSHHLIEPPTSLPGITVDRSVGRETWRLTQDVVTASVDARTAERRWDLTLDKGPYYIDYTRNGKYLLIGGKKGHVALMEWKAHRLLCEFDVEDEVNAVHFLHSHQMYAVAQRSSVYLYDSTGLELHVLPQHHQPLALDFLPYHFLLTSIGRGGWLKYHDTSTGVMVAQHRTRLGSSSVLTHNPRNGVSFIGHQNGVVTMWSPSMKEPLVRMLTQKAAVTAVAVSADGIHMVTSGLEGQWKVWDCRMYRQLHAYFSVRPVSSLSLSQTGMVGLGYGSHVAVWRDALSTKAHAPYLTHELPSHHTTSVRFCPFEDSLAVGHTGGVSSLLTPGAGLLAYDAVDADPFETKGQVRERIVHSLLEKLQPAMIGLNDSVVGMMDGEGKEVWEGERRDLRRRREEERKKREGKEKMRGGQKSSKRWRRKRNNIIDAKVVQRREQKEREAQQRAKAQKGAAEDGVPSALDRFKKR